MACDAKPMQPWGFDSFCPSWPSPARDEPLGADERAALRGAAHRALRPFEQGGVTQAALWKVLKTRCAQRLCLHVQIIKDELFVVAPHATPCTSYHDPSSACSPARRKATPGLSKPNVWNREWYPTRLEWHFYAGINVSQCSARTKPGDWNGPFTRLRLLTALRLLEEAVRRGDAPSRAELVLCVNETPLNAGGWCMQGPQPVFASTGNEEQPLIPFVHWLPKLRDFDYAVWGHVRAVRRKKAAANLAAAAAAAAAATGAGAGAGGPARTAVFRGGLYRLDVYSDRWRQRGMRRTAVGRDNWREVGRTAMIHARIEQGGGGGSGGGGGEGKGEGGGGTGNGEAGKGKKGRGRGTGEKGAPPDDHQHAGGGSGDAEPELNVHVSLNPAYTRELGLEAAQEARMDVPATLPMDKQQQLFRYVINAEGHGGWADRLYQLLLSPQLVLAQDLPARLWYEQLLAPGVTHLSVDSNFGNLSAVVRWARAHPREVEAMVASANRAADLATSLRGARAYVSELLRRYAELQQRSYRPRRHWRAVRFACRPSGESRECKIGGARRTHRGERCAFFSADGGAFDTLYDAAQTLPLASSCNEARCPPHCLSGDDCRDRNGTGTAARESRRPPPPPPLAEMFAPALRSSAHRWLCDASGRRNARLLTPPRRCVDLRDRDSCLRHYLAAPSGKHRQHRPCVWGPEGAAFPTTGATAASLAAIRRAEGESVAGIDAAAGTTPFICSCAPPEEHADLCEGLAAAVKA